MPIVRGGGAIYGLAVGIMVMDTEFPRFLGDIGHAGTWPFPVSYRVVPQAVPERLAQNEPDPSLLEPFIKTARQLELDGVGAIATSCGYLAIYQRELTETVSVPVFSSSLLQVPLAAQTIRSDKSVGILTAREVLTDRHFQGAGWSATDIPVFQVAPPDDSHFAQALLRNERFADPALLELDITKLAERAMREHPDTGAIVLECANLAPFAPAVRRATGVPVFDLYTLVVHAYLVTSGTLLDTVSLRPATSVRAIS